MHFKYRNNKTTGEVIFECDADDILEADKKLKEVTGIDAMKSPWVGCEVTFDKNSA